MEITGRKLGRADYKRHNKLNAITIKQARCIQNIAPGTQAPKSGTGTQGGCVSRARQSGDRMASRKDVACFVLNFWYKQ